MNNIQLVIPMSGMGRRFLENGYTDPKPLIEVDGFPIIKYVVDLFPSVNDISFICNTEHLENSNMRSTLESLFPQSKIYEVPYGVGKGPVEAVLRIQDFIDDEKQTIVSYCDYGTVWDFKNFLEYISVNDLDGSIPCYTGFHPHMLGSDNYAFCKTDSNNNLLSIKEKEPFTDNKMGEYASNGTYYFKTGKILKKYFKELMDLDINVNGEFYVSLVYNLLVRDGHRVGIYEIDKMLQWGTPYDLEIYKSWSNYFSKKELPEVKNPEGTTLVLPMAGKGSRFFEKGYGVPKPLLEIDDEPMIVKAVDCLPKSDNNLFICLDEHLKDFNLREILSRYPNCMIKSIQETTNGQACTCEIGITEFKVDLDRPIMISACDNGVYYDVDKYLEMVDDLNNDIIVWSFRNNQSSKVNPNMYAWLDVDDHGFVRHVSCKKFIYEDPLKTHAIIGTMFFRKARYFIEGLKKNYEENITTNGEFYVDDVLNQNIKSGLSVRVFEVENYICWGTPDDYRTYNYWRDHFCGKNL